MVTSPGAGVKTRCVPAKFDTSCFSNLLPNSAQSAGESIFRIGSVSRCLLDIVSYRVLRSHRYWNHDFTVEALKLSLRGDVSMPHQSIPSVRPLADLLRSDPVGTEGSGVRSISENAVAIPCFLTSSDVRARPVFASWHRLNSCSVNEFDILVPRHPRSNISRYLNQ